MAVIVSESVVWTEEESLLSGLGRHPQDLTQDSRPSCHPLCGAENRFFIKVFIHVSNIVETGFRNLGFRALTPLI